MKSLRIIVFVILIIIVLPGCCAFKASLDTPIASKGVLDLSTWNLNEHDTIKLDGEWEFYWKRFISSSDLVIEKPDRFVEVPSVWNMYSINGKQLSGEGYASYRLHIKTSLAAGSQLGLRINNFSSAYNLYIDEKLIASNGKVSDNKFNEVGEYKPQAAFFNIPSKEFDIVIHVSNFQYARGGFWYTISMGSMESINNLHDSIMGKETFLLGVLAIISLFYLTVFILLRELKYSLYFACLCMTMALAMDMVGQFILLRFLQGLRLNSVVYIWYSSTVWVVFFIIIYMHELFKSKFSDIVMKVYMGVAIVCQIIFTLTPLTFYTRLGQVVDFIEILGTLATIIIVGIGIKKGQKDGWLNIASMIIVLSAYIHDDLYWTNIIDSSIGELIYGGLFLFIFLQMIIQAKRIREFFDQKTAAELSFLQAQIKPHFLYNAINTFISISRYDTEQARELLIEFSNYLRRSFDFKDLSQSVPLKNEIELAKAYIDIEKARFEERLEVHMEVCDDMEVRVPILMLQPVIENAVNHGILPKPEGGRIEVIVRRENGKMLFSVKDDGVGMELEKKSSTSKCEYGSGVGLSNIDSRLKKLYGKGLEINSSIGSGTEIRWCIPINNGKGE